MIRPASPVRTAMAWVVVLLSLTLVGCTAGTDDETAPTGQATTSPSQMASPGSSGPASQTFGTGCPNLPSSGPGSLQDLAQQDWVTALALTPALSQWSVVTTIAGLQADLARHSEVTVFVPVDDAFRTYGTERVRQLLLHPRQAGDLLRYHVVTDRLSPEELPGSHQTLAGKPIEITGSGEDFVVNGDAKVVCGNLQTANATIYLIDRVLEP